MAMVKCSTTIREGWEMNIRYRQGPGTCVGAKFPMGIPRGWELKIDCSACESENKYAMSKAELKFSELDGLVIMSELQFNKFKSDLIEEVNCKSDTGECNE